MDKAMTVANQGMGVAKELKEFFKQEKVSREDVDEAQRLLSGKLLHSWNENLYQNVTKDIMEDKFDEFVKSLCDSYSLDKSTLGALQVIKYSKGTNHLVYKVNCQQDNFDAKYGYIVITKDTTNKTFSCGYAIYELQFKLADQVERVSTPTYFLGFFRMGDKVEEVPKLAKFGLKDIEHVKDMYLKYKALQALQNAGTIDQITYA